MPSDNSRQYRYILYNVTEAEKSAELGSGRSIEVFAHLDTDLQSLLSKKAKLSSADQDAVILRRSEHSPWEILLDTGEWVLPANLPDDLPLREYLQRLCADLDVLWMRMSEEIDEIQEIAKLRYDPTDGEHETAEQADKLDQWLRDQNRSGKSVHRIAAQLPRFIPEEVVRQWLTDALQKG